MVYAINELFDDLILFSTLYSYQTNKEWLWLSPIDRLDHLKWVFFIHNINHYAYNTLSLLIKTTPEDSIHSNNGWSYYKKEAVYRGE